MIDAWAVGAGGPLSFPIPSDFGRYVNTIQMGVGGRLSPTGFSDLPKALTCMGLLCNKSVRIKKSSVTFSETLLMLIHAHLIPYMDITNVLQLYKTTVLFLTASIS